MSNGLSNGLLVGDTLVDDALDLGLERGDDVVVRGLVLIGAEAVPDGVEVLRRVDEAEQHAVVALQHQSQRGVHLEGAST